MRISDWSSDVCSSDLGWLELWRLRRNASRLRRVRRPPDPDHEVLTLGHCCDDPSDLRPERPDPPAHIRAHPCPTARGGRCAAPGAPRPDPLRPALDAGAGVGRAPYRGGGCRDVEFTVAAVPLTKKTMT